MAAQTAAAKSPRPPRERRRGPDPALPARLLEIDVFPDRLEIVERYGEGAAEELARELSRLGLATALVFRAPCG